MLSKILAALLALATIAALWYRSEAATSTAEAASWKAASEQLAKGAAASERATTFRRQVADRRKEQHDDVLQQDQLVLVEHEDWATQPVPAAVIERLRAGSLGSSDASARSSDSTNP